MEEEDPSVAHVCSPSVDKRQGVWYGIPYNKIGQTKHAGKWPNQGLPKE